VGVDKHRLTQSLYRWAKVYFIVAVLPAGLFVSGFTVYHFIQTPELFSYQKLECAHTYGNFSLGCSEPVNTSTLYTGTYTPRIVDDDEYEHLERQTQAYQLRITLCFLLGVGFLILNGLHKRGKI